MIEDHFEKIYIVNLDDRLDKWQTVVEELKKVGLKHYERFSAIKPNIEDYPVKYYNRMRLAGANHTKYKIGALGCKLSHVDIIKNAFQQKLNSILILEDDAEFHPQANELIDQAIKELPQDWDMFYLGGNHKRRFSMISEHIARIAETHTTHAYAIHQSAYELVINQALEWGAEIDEFYRKYMHVHHNCYCIRPHIVFQTAGFSDILQGNRDYQVLRK